MVDMRWIYGRSAKAGGFAAREGYGPCRTVLVVTLLFYHQPTGEAALIQDH